VVSESQHRLVLTSLCFNRNLLDGMIRTSAKIFLNFIQITTNRLKYKTLMWHLLLQQLIIHLKIDRYT